ncbi:MAG: hypothetical protein ACJASN_001250 [Cyclobacteriaceae bacterium]|jgi:hypothetical protein
MKNTILTLVAAIFLYACSNTSSKENKDAESTESTAQHDHSPKEADTSKKKPLSPRTSSMALIDSNHIHIDYGSPGKRGRMIFGGLVGYGTVWATGAHKATIITFDEDVNINDVDVPAGKYGLFTIPGESEWTIIISKDWDMHLADDYIEINDLVRVVAPVQLLVEEVESLTFEVKETDSKTGEVTIKWDQTAVSFEIKNK